MRERTQLKTSGDRAMAYTVPTGLATIVIGRIITEEDIHRLF